MPGGNTGGAKAAGRFCRHASLSITTSETDIELDMASAINPFGEPFNSELASGNIKSLVEGVAVVDLTLTIERDTMADIGITLRAYMIPDGESQIPIGVGEHVILAGSGTQTFNLPVFTPIGVDGIIRFTAQLSTGALALTVGELGSWAYFVLG